MRKLFQSVCLFTEANIQIQYVTRPMKTGHVGT